MELRDEITRVALDLYLRSGRLEHHELDHWLEAEKLVFTWFESFKEREQHVGADVPDEHSVRPSYDEVMN